MMSNLTSMFQAVEFIEAHLKGEIAVADIADAVFFSLYHFCRTFNKFVHHSPYDYLMRRRLSESAQELAQTDKKIIEIAFDYQFNSPEAYSRAFKRMFGTQPSQWKKHGAIDPRSLMSRLSFAHIKHRNEGDYLKPVLEEKDAFQVAGLMTLVNDDQTVIPRLWEMLAQELQGIEEAVKPKRFYGITCYPKDWAGRGFFYLAAVEIKTLDVADSPLVVKTIPALKCARFIHKGPREDLRLTRDYIYQTWLPKSGRGVSHPLEIECYGRDFPGADSATSEREIYIPIE